MLMNRVTKSLAAGLVLATLSFCVWAQEPQEPAQEPAPKAAQEAAPGQPDWESLKSKIAIYITELNPGLQDVQVESIEKEAGMPFMKGTISFNNRGRTQQTNIYVTEDAQYLILGQVWDLAVDPLRARWQDLKEGADERMARIDLSERPSRGNPDARVVVVEFSDYQCGFCARAHSTIEGQLIEKYNDRIKFVYKHLPLTQIHPWAMKASIAAACAYEQNPEAFWGIHSKIFESQREITVENLREKVQAFAGELNLESEPMMACFDNEATKEVVETDLKEAAELGVNSTPTFLINGALVAGALPFDQFSSYVDLALEEAGSKNE